VRWRARKCTGRARQEAEQAPPAGRNRLSRGHKSQSKPVSHPRPRIRHNHASQRVQRARRDRWSMVSMRRRGLKNGQRQSSVPPSTSRAEFRRAYSCTSDSMSAAIPADSPKTPRLRSTDLRLATSVVKTRAMCAGSRLRRAALAARLGTPLGAGKYRRTSETGLGGLRTCKPGTRRGSGRADVCGRGCLTNQRCCDAQQRDGRVLRPEREPGRETSRGRTFLGQPHADTRLLIRWLAR
jgi:hypothetical protein